MSNQEVQETIRVTRKSLRTLQHSASDRENLVGRPSENLKHQLTLDPPVEVEVKRKTLSPKVTQANLDTKISVDDLTNPEASEIYWKILAEKRQIALQEALTENQKLLEIIEDLKKENKLTKHMLEEANSFIEVVKEELANNSNDTGIDVNDVSTSEETENSDQAETAIQN